MQRLKHVVVWIEQGAMIVVTTLMTAIMVVVSLDVVMRYGLRSPLPWVHDFVSLYAMAGIFFLALAPSYRERAHIGVDVLLEHMPPRARIWSDLLGDIIGLCIFSLIAYFGFQRTWVSFVHGDVLAGLIPWPTWLYNGAVPLGSAILCIRLAINAISNIEKLRESSTDGGERAREAQL